MARIALMGRRAVEPIRRSVSRASNPLKRAQTDHILGADGLAFGDIAAQIGRTAEAHLVAFRYFGGLRGLHILPHQHRDLLQIVLELTELCAGQGHLVVAKHLAFATVGEVELQHFGTHGRRCLEGSASD